MEQEALKSSSVAMEVDRKFVLDEINIACAKSEPNQGELWNRTRKQARHRRLSDAEVLKVVVQAILTHENDAKKNV